MFGQSILVVPEALQTVGSVLGLALLLHGGYGAILAAAGPTLIGVLEGDES